MPTSDWSWFLIGTPLISRILSPFSKWPYCSGCKCSGSLSNIIYDITVVCVCVCACYVRAWAHVCVCLCAFHWPLYFKREFAIRRHQAVEFKLHRLWVGDEYLDHTHHPTTVRQGRISRISLNHVAILTAAIKETGKLSTAYRHTMINTYLYWPRIQLCLWAPITY